MKKLLFTTLSIFCFSFVSKAQDLETILLAKDDAEKLTNAYLQPAFKGLIYSMNNGWYHTAKVHKKFGFDITIGASASIIPEKDEIFNLASLGLSGNISPQSGTSPTIGGSSDDGLEITYTEEVTAADLPDGVDTSLIPANTSYTYSTSFELPGGVKDDLPLNAVPAPSIQVGLGLPYKFEVIGRFSPEVGSDDVKGKLFGLGVKKEITSIFGPMEKTPLHISLLAAFTNMSVDYNMGSGDIENQISYSNAAAEFELKSYTVQAIASLNFPFINFYGGIGYNGGKTTLNMLGDYTLSYELEYNGVPSGIYVNEQLSDPFSFESSVSGVNATIGTRLSLGFFKIFASYTMQEYNSINGGIAISIR